jgi:hypothetical protein
MRQQEYPLAHLVDFSNASLIYLGEAKIAAIGSDPVWRISRLTITATSVKTEWANGNEQYSNIWDNRTTLSYS